MGLEWGGIFGILKKIKKIFLFKKVCYFKVRRLFFGVWGGFGEFDVFLGLGFDIRGFVFCWRWFFELFLGLVGALRTSFCIVVTKI